MREVGEELGEHVHHRVVVVGGSLLALHGLRQSTVDVDSVSPLAPDLVAAVELVGDRQGLRADWLNDRARAFAPDGFDVAHCDVLLRTENLEVLGAPFRDVFLMKLRRGSPQDLIDMRSLWPEVSDHFESASDIVDAFYEAFPVEPVDDFLGSFVVQELAKADIDLPLE